MRRNLSIHLLAIAALVAAAPSPLIAGEVTSSFGMRKDPFHGGQRRHNGLDIAAPTGTPVYATANGVVDYASWKGSYGKLIQIKHPSGHETRFAHLSEILIVRGQVVRKGQLIGRVGSTGRSTGPHLHYEVRYRGKPLDPRSFM